MGKKVGYLRISDADQVQGLSPEIQRKALREAGAEWILEDLGRSGFKGARPAFEELLRDIESGKVSQVICNTYSRLSRNANDSARLDEALALAGASVLDLGTGQELFPKELTPELLALLARHESHQKSKRQHQTNSRFRAEGKLVSSKAPWGLRIPTRASKRRGEDPPDAVERQPVVDPDAYKQARLLIEHYLKSSETTRALWQWAVDNEHINMPIGTPHGLHKWFHHPLVRTHILRPGEYQQICLIQKSYRTTGNRGRSAGPNWHRALVFCNQCKKPLCAANKRRALRCNNPRCPNTSQIRLETLYWAASYAFSKASEYAPQKLIELQNRHLPGPEEREIYVSINTLEDAIKASPKLKSQLEPMIIECQQRLEGLRDKDISHWEIFSLSWLKGLAPLEWYWMPNDLKPSVYRQLLKGIFCDGQDVELILFKDDSEGVLPPAGDKIVINNSGAFYPPDYREAAGFNAIDPEYWGDDIMNWREMLDQGFAGHG